MKTIFTLALILFSFQAKADGSLADFAKEASATLAKSGSFATCSLEGREVEDAVKAISAAYAGKFSIQVTTRAYNNGTSAKACIVLNSTEVTQTSSANSNATASCQVGYIFTSQYGCLPQGACQMGYGYYNGQCVPTSSAMQSVQSSCPAGYYMTTNGCVNHPF